MHQILRDHRARRARGENGFTLIELLVVVVILGVLIAIAIPVYLNYRRGANDAATESDVRNAVSVLEVCNVGNGKYPVFSTAPTWTYSSTSTPPVTSVGPCENQRLSLSPGTSIKYFTNSSGTAGACYALFGTNSNGAPKFWSYSSTTGGGVTASTQALYSAAAAPATC